MTTDRIGRSLAYLALLATAAGVAHVACSKVDTVPSGDTGPARVVNTCGDLDAAQAAQIATSRLEHLASVGLTAVSGIENSRSVARLLSFGDGAIIEPFLEEALTDLHESLVELRDEQLVPTNVEVAQGGSVTFLLKPETSCKDDTPTMAIVPATGGTSGQGGGSSVGGATTTLDPDCVKQYTEHPVRVRISRIACDQGDNVAVEVLRGAQPERLARAELYAESAELELDLGAFLRATVSTSYSSIRQADGTYIEQSTEKPIVSEAEGVLRGTLTLTGSAQAQGKISVTRAIDYTTADEDAVRVRIAAGTDVATISADGSSKWIRVTANLGAVDWRTRFDDFISGFFGLDVTSEGSTEDPVDTHVAGLRGQLYFEAASDTVAAEGLDLGGSAATAIQGNRTLLSVGAANAEQKAIDASLQGMQDDSLRIGLPKGLSLEIRYGLEPVMTVLENPANYLARDTLSVGASASAVVSLLPEADQNDLAITDRQTGSLVRVDLGTLSLKSATWPNDSIEVGSNQCLARTEQDLGERHDLMDDFAVGACSE